MSLESDLLFAQQAMKLGFVEEAAVSEALRVCGGHELPEEMVRRKLLTPDEVAAMKSVVEALLRRKSAAATKPEAPPPAAASPAPVLPAPAQGAAVEGSRGGNLTSGIARRRNCGPLISRGAFAAEAPGGVLLLMSAGRQHLPE